MSARSERLWFMNADCEMELAVMPREYRRRPTIARRNRDLAPTLRWLAHAGDAMLVERPWDAALLEEAERRGIEIVAPGEADEPSSRRFSPWGWTPSAVAEGIAARAVVDAPPLEVVARVNSKRFSHELERALGVDARGAALAASRAELDEAVALACPGADDKWVVKSLFGFAARDRVLGRGPRLDAASATWADRRLGAGETLLFERWHEVVREYGVPIWIGADDTVDVLGVVDVLTNGAGASIGYRFGRALDPGIRASLVEIAERVGRHLAAAGYCGPAGIDALECVDGLRPLLEINARYTMGFVALAVERSRGRTTPHVWTPR